MSLAEAVAASLVLMVGASASAQMWSQALRGSWELAQREAQLQRVDALVLASEGKARELASSANPSTPCADATGQLVAHLRALPSGDGQPATLTVPSSHPGVLHLRWESGGVIRERLLSPSALGLCREASHGP